jgi:hypothetical protein
MTYSTLIHSSIVNPAKPNLVKENTTDSVDTVTLDVPLLTRILEVAREDLKTDEDLHNVVERLIQLTNKGPLTMADYDQIMGKKVDSNQAELESILKLAGI